VAWLTVRGKKPQKLPRPGSAPEPAAASALRPHGITELGAMVVAISGGADGDERALPEQPRPV